MTKRSDHTLCEFTRHSFIVPVPNNTSDAASLHVAGNLTATASFGLTRALGAKYYNNAAGLPR